MSEARKSLATYARAESWPPLHCLRFRRTAPATDDERADWIAQAECGAMLPLVWHAHDTAQHHPAAGEDACPFADDPAALMWRLAFRDARQALGRPVAAARELWEYADR